MFQCFSSTGAHWADGSEATVRSDPPQEPLYFRSPEQSGGLDWTVSDISSCGDGMAHVVVEAPCMFHVLVQRRWRDIQTVQGGVVVCGVWCTLRVVSMFTFLVARHAAIKAAKLCTTLNSINCAGASDEAKCPPRLTVHRELTGRCQLDPAGTIPSRELTHSSSTFHWLSSRH